MKIYETAQKIPGGVMVAPLLLGALINTFIPDALTIGSFTTALFKTGAVTFIALACFCCGAAIDVRQATLPLTKGAALVAVKMVIGVSIGWTVGRIFGPAGIFGLAPLAIIPALSNASGGLYIALASEYGDPTDVAAQSMLILSEGPFFTILIFGATGMAEIPLIALLASILPVIVGFILGNLDPEIRGRFSNSQIVIPFMAFCLGANLDLRTVVHAGLPGLGLGRPWTWPGVRPAWRPWRVPDHTAVQQAIPGRRRGNRLHRRQRHDHPHDTGGRRLLPVAAGQGLHRPNRRRCHHILHFVSVPRLFPRQTADQTSAAMTTSTFPGTS